MIDLNCGQDDTQYLIESGLFADFVKGKWRNVDRKEFRKLAGYPFQDGVNFVPVSTSATDPVTIDCNQQPEIPDWADKKNPIMKHTACGVIDPSKLTVASVFADRKEKDVLEGEEFIIRAQKLNSMNACAFDFYAKPENWKYLPKNVDAIVFPQTVFRGSYGNRCVRCLYRSGAGWVLNYIWLDGRFDHNYLVAVLAS